MLYTLINRIHTDLGMQWGFQLEWWQWKMGHQAWAILKTWVCLNHCQTKQEEQDIPYGIESNGWTESGHVCLIKIARGDLLLGDSNHLTEHINAVHLVTGGCNSCSNRLSCSTSYAKYSASRMELGTGSGQQHRQRLGFRYGYSHSGGPG